MRASKSLFQFTLKSFCEILGLLKARRKSSRHPSFLLVLLELQSPPRRTAFGQGMLAKASDVRHVEEMSEGS